MLGLRNFGLLKFQLYIESLPSQLSRRTMTQCLARIADILAELPPAEDQRENERRARDLRWADLTSAHVEVIKARISEKVSKATANKMLSARAAFWRKHGHSG